ncbi:MAG TPA: YciI family protein [Candidatus Nitrosotalea sp.]|nr:YciI family protein [Candidatus Nitrosotalea sp.]
MRYLLVIGSENKTPGPPPSQGEMQAILQGHTRLGEELRAAGKVVAAERLRPDTDGTRIRFKAGQRQVTDGPFTETKEAIGGFYLIECATKAEAVEWAKKVPLGEGGFVEVRPIWPM